MVPLSQRGERTMENTPTAGRRLKCSGQVAPMSGTSTEATSGAVAPLIKVIDRLDKHQVTVVAKYDYGPEGRKRLLDKVNRIVDNLQPLDRADPAAEEPENISDEIPA
jgi:hypothetical protein